MHIRRVYVYNRASVLWQLLLFISEFLSVRSLERNGAPDDKRVAESDNEVQNGSPFFHARLLDCLLNNSSLLLLTDSPAGVRWYFFLLGRLRSVDIGQASQQVASLMRELTNVYKERTTDLNLALLRSE